MLRNERNLREWQTHVYECYDDATFHILLKWIGITNGIDDVDWDPSSDRHIGFHYSAKDLSGKVAKILFVVKSCVGAEQ